MIWAMDMDGVLCDINITQLQIMSRLGAESEEFLEDLYYAERKPLLDPQSLLAEDDIFYIITARGDHLADITKRWLDKYCPNYEKLFLVGEEGWDKEGDFDSWLKWNGEAKARKIQLMKELGVEIYIDDSPSSVKTFREELDIPIIQYGGRLSN